MPSSLSGFIEIMLETSNDKRRSINYVKNVSQNSDKITDFYNVTKHGELYHELMSIYYYKKISIQVVSTRQEHF